nr:hypothetical protein [Tanacetum cinerariifolium]
TSQSCSRYRSTEQRRLCRAVKNGGAGLDLAGSARPARQPAAPGSHTTMASIDLGRHYAVAGAWVEP